LGAAGIELEIQGEQLRNNNLLEVSIIDILDPFKKILISINGSFIPPLIHITGVVNQI
jgi:hypothetical protein